MTRAQTASVSDPSLPAWLASLRGFLRGLGVVEAYLAIGALVFVTAINAVQISLRMGATFSIWWAQEVSELLILVTYFIGVAVVYKLRQDVIITFAADRAGARGRLGMMLFAHGCILVFCALTAWLAIELAPQRLTIRSYILGIPVFYASVPLILASLSLALTGLYHGLALWHVRGAIAAGESPESLEDRIGVFAADEKP
jgi:TRAP-type C4-dicarboxylate transport system permease small subunit